MLEPDSLDRQIIIMLQGDGRCSNREIARNLGVPEATVRYRVRRLTEGGWLRITALVDPIQLGYHLTAVISIQAESQRVSDIAHTLSAFPEVMFLVVTTGQHDIMLTATFLSQEHLYSFLSERVANIPGVTRTDTAIGLNVIKRDFEWVSALTSNLTEPTCQESVNELPATDGKQ